MHIANCLLEKKFLVKHRKKMGKEKEAKQTEDNNKNLK
jgi:hypothetical protein